MTTYTAARILKGQLQNQTGEETVMTMDTFPNVGLVKVKHQHRKIHTTGQMSVFFSQCILSAKKHPYMSANIENQVGRSCPVINLHYEFTKTADLKVLLCSVNFRSVIVSHYVLLYA